MLVVEGCRTPQKLTAEWSPCARQKPGLLHIGPPASPARAHKAFSRAALRVEVLLTFLPEVAHASSNMLVRHAFGHIMHAHTHTLDSCHTLQTCSACSVRAEMSCMHMLTTLGSIST